MSKQLCCPFVSCPFGVFYPDENAGCIREECSCPKPISSCIRCKKTWYEGDEGPCDCYCGNCGDYQTEWGCSCSPDMPEPIDTCGICGNDVMPWQPNDGKYHTECRTKPGNDLPF